MRQLPYEEQEFRDRRPDTVEVSNEAGEERCKNCHTDEIPFFALRDGAKRVEAATHQHFPQRDKQQSAEARMRIVGGMALTGKRALVAGAIGCALCLAGLAGAYVLNMPPAHLALADIRLEATPGRKTRGEYLFMHLLRCASCHSQRRWQYFSGPIKPQSVGAGGECFDERYGVPGKICAPNITPDIATGIGAWRDGQIVRAIREGIDADNHNIFPIMAHPEYRLIPDEDVFALVIFMRSLKPLRRERPPRELRFAAQFLLGLERRPEVASVAPVDTTHGTEYGRYLTLVAGCKFCHTPVDENLLPVPHRAFAGGREHIGPWGRAFTPNITAHETGLKNNSIDNFIGRFRAFDIVGIAPVLEGGPNTPMPWSEYAGLAEADFRAIYAYLRSIEPIDNSVEKWPHLQKSAIPHQPSP